jgi:hypothetical protein
VTIADGDGAMYSVWFFISTTSYPNLTRQYSELLTRHFKTGIIFNRLFAGSRF